MRESLSGRSWSGCDDQSEGTTQEDEDALGVSDTLIVLIIPQVNRWQNLATFTLNVLYVLFQTEPAMFFLVSKSCTQTGGGAGGELSDMPSSSKNK